MFSPSDRRIMLVTLFAAACLASNQSLASDKPARVLVLADSQFHHISSLPFSHRTPNADSVGPAIRPVPMDVFAPDLFRAEIESIGELPSLALYLGDMLDLSCESELEVALTELNHFPFWLWTPGNHDGMYQGNLAKKGDRSANLEKNWNAACANSQPVTKATIIARYLSNLASSCKDANCDPGLLQLIDYLECIAGRSTKFCTALVCEEREGRQNGEYFYWSDDANINPLLCGDATQFGALTDGYRAVPKANRQVTRLPNNCVLPPVGDGVIPNVGYWVYSGSSQAYLLGVAWYLNPLEPQNSFLFQVVSLDRSSDYRHIALLSDTSVFPTVEDGYIKALVKGRLGRKGRMTYRSQNVQAILLDDVLNHDRNRATLYFLSHHPHKRQSRFVKKDVKWFGFDYAIAGHTHTIKGPDIIKGREGAQMTQWVIGSTADWSSRRTGPSMAWLDIAGKAPTVQNITFDDAWSDECDPRSNDFDLPSLQNPSYRRCLESQSTKEVTFQTIARLVYLEALKALELGVLDPRTTVHAGELEWSLVQLRTELEKRIAASRWRKKIDAAAESRFVETVVKFLRTVAASDDAPEHSDTWEAFKVCRALWAGQGDIRDARWRSSSRDAGVRVRNNAKCPLDKFDH